MIDEPKEGDRRNFQRKFVQAPPQEFELPGGEKVMFPMGGTDTYTEEQYCAACQRWYEVEGVLGSIVGCTVCAEKKRGEAS